MDSPLIEKRLTVVWTHCYTQSNKICSSVFIARVAFTVRVALSCIDVVACSDLSNATAPFIVTKKELLPEPTRTARKVHLV